MPSDSKKGKCSSVELVFANRKEEKSSSSEKKVKEPDKSKDVENETQTGKTLLEILELEMRARAIRALLKQQDGEETNCDTATTSATTKPIFRKRKHKDKECTTSHVNDDLNKVSSKPTNKKLSVNIKTDESKVKLEKNDDAKKKYGKGTKDKSRIGQDLSVKKSPHKIGKKRTSDAFDREDGELSSEDESVLVLPGNDNDVIVLDDSDDVPEASCSWASRWLQSKDVQRVVTTSKMCAKIRNRMRVNKIHAIDTAKSSSSVVIEGSVNEYKMLDKPK